MPASTDAPRDEATRLESNTPESAPGLRAVDLLGILGFWTAYALLTSANRLLDPRGTGFRAVPPIASVEMAFIESYLWALLTPLIFVIASRLTLDRERRGVRLAGMLASGVIISAVMVAVVEMVRRALYPAPLPPTTLRPGGSQGFAWVGRRIFFLQDLIIYSGILAVGLARTYSRDLRSRQQRAALLEAEKAHLEAQLALARLDALRMQLDPHFLFNTLHAVSSLVERDPKGVRRMITRLSELLRHSIEGGGEQEIPLRQELDLLQRYLDIMQVRFQGRLEVTNQLDERALDALVPNLVLQPLVENAIKHGTSKVDGPGRVWIEAAVDDPSGQLVLRIRNDGPAVDLAAVSADAGGVGLRNTRARLSGLYDGDQSFSLRPAEGGGSVAEVRIPFHTSADLRSAIS